VAGAFRYLPVIPSRRVQQDIHAFVGNGVIEQRLASGFVYLNPARTVTGSIAQMLVQYAGRF